MEESELLDLFAGLAMQALFAHAAHMPIGQTLNNIAETAYKQADAMMAERKKRQDVEDTGVPWKQNNTPASKP